jgi:hypothetical protein
VGLRSLEAPVSDLARFMDYARAFEIAFLTGDWTHIEPFFAPDALHHVASGPPLALHDRGRDAVVAGLRASVDGMDRRFDARIPEILEGPVPREDGVFMRFGLTLVRAGLPDLHLEGDHLTRYRDGLIARIDERIPEESAAAVRSHLERHAAVLHPAGTRRIPTDPAQLRAIERATRRSLVRAYACAKSAQDVAAALAVCHEGFCLESVGFGLASRDRKQAEQQLELFFRVFPDYAVTLEGMAEGDDHVATWGRARMTFAGELFGRAPTHRTADLPVACVFGFRDGLLAGERFFFDLAGLCEGIGVPVEELSRTLGSIREASR